MGKELELWQFIHDRLAHGENVMLLVVAASSGSSPGRAGYKMAVAADGELCGSIGGGVMEVRLVEEAKMLLSEPGAIAAGFREQVHRSNSPNASGMICSGKQTVIYKMLTPDEAMRVDGVVYSLKSEGGPLLIIQDDFFAAGPPECPTDERFFQRYRDGKFAYSELLGPNHDVYIIGGGHCALALSEVMSKLDFSVTIFDDRADLNTINKNTFADNISIIDDYQNIGEKIPNWDHSYVVVMTVGYASDKVVIKALYDREFKYFGVLGSKAKMATLMKELKDEGIPAEQLAKIHTPIGIPINSRTPEEIAVSIAAEIIAVKSHVG